MERGHMKQLLWLWIQTLRQKGRQLLIILASMLLFWMILMLSMARVLVFQEPTKEHLAHASSAFSHVVPLPPGAAVDPTPLIGQPHVFDARPCVANPTERSLSGHFAAHVSTQAR